jgi:hypothetical protein
MNKQFGGSLTNFVKLNQQQKSMTLKLLMPACKNGLFWIYKSWLIQVFINITTLLVDGESLVLYGGNKQPFAVFNSQWGIGSGCLRILGNRSLQSTKSIQPNLIDFFAAVWIAASAPILFE